MRQYGGPAVTDCASAIAVDNSGSVYVTGKSEGDSIFLEFATVKYSSSGDLVWTQRYQGPGAGHNAATDLALDGLGNVYVTGSSQGVSTGYDFATIRYTELLCGDANGDETVDLGDVVYLIGYLYRNEPAPDPIAAGDVNRDGIVDLGDVVYLVTYLYKGGLPPCSDK